MRKFLRSRVVEWFFGLVTSFWIFAPFMDQPFLSALLTGILMSGWLGLLIAYWRGVWRVVRDPQSTLGGKLVMIGIAGLALGIEGVFAWSLLFVYLDQPEWMRMHIVRSFALWIFAVATWTLLIAGNVGDRALIPGENWPRFGAITAVAVTLTIAFIYLAGGFPR
jgi:hypothetical protein